MTTFTHHYLTANKKLLPIKDQIEGILLSAEKRILNKLEKVEVDVVISHHPSVVIPEFGISGKYTKEIRLIELMLDTEHQYLLKNLKEEITRSLSHEYMHAVREEYVPWEDGTLLDSMVAEGLTQSFEIEVQPGIKPPMYATNLNESELNAAWEKVKPLLQEEDYDYQAWFFGSDEIKRWTGYSLGYWLVQNKMRKDGNKASDLVQTPSNDFIN